MYSRYIKRFLDIFFSGLFIILLLPMYLLLAVIVRINMGSPVIFKQERPGLDEKIFSLIKFRTMSDKKGPDGRLLPDEERLTAFGKALRRTSLDELPELFNILKGDMSFVGPRPLLVRYLPFYTEEERKRHSVRPGLTGLAQVNGRDALVWEKRFKMDIFYAEHQSFLFDLGIIIMTAFKILKKADILDGNEQTLPDFDVYRRGQAGVKKSEADR